MTLSAGFLVTMPRLSVIAIGRLYFQGVHGASPLQAALKVTLLAAGLTIGSLLADALTRLAEERRVMLAAGLVTMMGLLLLTWAVGVGNVPGFLVGLTIVGLGNGVFHPLNSSMVMRSAPLASAGSVNAFRVMVQSSGAALSTAVTLALISSGVTEAVAKRFFAGKAELISPSQIEQIGQGYQLAFGALTALLVVGLVATAMNLRRQRHA